MKSRHLHQIRQAYILTALLSLAVPEGVAGDYSFTLVPKAFQRAPVLDMTINTELTQYGRLMRSPTPENPVRYVAKSAGFKPMGQALGGERPPKPEQLEGVFEQALAEAGFLPAKSPEERPALAIIYYWGSHNRLDEQLAADFRELAIRHQIERSRLVGGTSLASRVVDMIENGDSLSMHTAEIEFLRHQASNDLYYVVASAYEYDALARNERKLVWRTTMTVNAVGISMKESIPPLIANAGPYFGRETAMPKIARPRIQRWGVKVGEDRVIESDVQLPNRTPTPSPNTTESGK